LGWTLFGVVWGLAAVGVLLKSTGRLAHSGWSNALYLLMGWLIVAALGPLIRGLSAAAIAWLVAGGLAYTAGVVFYVADHKRYAHFIWHLFVLTGTGCHAGAIWCLASAGAAGR
jgi:hemolysin III